MPTIRLEIYDTNDSALVAVTERVLELSYDLPTDDIGPVKFSLPRSDPAAGELTIRRYVRAFVDGTLRSRCRIYEEPAELFLSDEPVISVDTFNTFGDLMLETAEDSRWVQKSLSTILGTGAGSPPVYPRGLLNGTGWTLDIEAGPGAILATVEAAGESLYTVIAKAISDNLSAADEPLHWWADPLTKVLHVGVLGASSGLRIANPQSPNPDGSVPNIFVEGEIEQRPTGEIVNSLDPYGGSDGPDRITLPFPCDTGAYTVLSRVSRQGGTIYYIEDDGSVGSYGRSRQAWSDNTQNTRNLTTAEAKQALYQAACSYLKRVKDPRRAWRCAVRGAGASPLVPGQSVHLWAWNAWRSTTVTGALLEEGATLDVTAYLTKIGISVDAEGIRYALEMGSTLDHRLGSSDAESIGKAIVEAGRAGGRPDTTRVVTTGAIPSAGGAPADAEYVTLLASAKLSQERILTAGAGIDVTDGGAGAAVTVAVKPAGHDMVAGHAYAGGAALDIFGLSAPNTIARLTPSSNPGAAAAILKSDTSGLLQTQGLGAGVAPAAGEVRSSGNIRVGAQLAIASNVIRAVISKAGIADNVATEIFKVTTTNEAGNNDGGGYVCHVRGMIGHQALSANTSCNVKYFAAHFVRRITGAGTGTLSAVVEEYDDSAITDLIRGIGDVVMTVAESTEYDIRVSFQIDLTGSSVVTGEVLLEVTLNWAGFLTAPAIAAV